MAGKKYEIPVTMFVFRRLDTVKMSMDVIRQVQPATMYIFADGAREGRPDESKKVAEVREYIKSAVDWECDLHLEFAEENLGYAKNIRNGFNKALKENSCGIFLEDDVIPSLVFFEYCREMLQKYEKNNDIQYVAGFNGIGENQIIKESYTFGRTAPMSGAIATWADRWNNCDFSAKTWPENKRINKFKEYYFTRELRKISYKEFDHIYKYPDSEWDIQFEYDMLDKNRFAIAPCVNIAESYGNVDATHLQAEKAGALMAKYMGKTEREFIYPIVHPTEVVWNKEYDKRRQYIYLRVNGNYLHRHIIYIWRPIKDYLYKHLSKKAWNRLKKIKTWFLEKK